MKDKPIYKIARTNEDKKRALELVRETYDKEGYTTSDTERNDFFNTMPPNTTTFNTFLYTGQMLGTISLVFDEDGSIPMNTLYNKEISILRNKGLKIAEVSRFAVNKDFPHLSHKTTDKIKHKLEISIELFKIIFHYSLHKKIDALCIAINPKHAMLYNSLGFNNLGELRNYPSVNNAPAVAKIMHLKEAVNDIANKNSLMAEIITNPPKNIDFNEQ